MLILSKNIRLRYCDDACYAVNISNNRIVRLSAAAMHTLEAEVTAGKVSMSAAYELGPKVATFIDTLVQVGILTEVQNERHGIERVV